MNRTVTLQIDLSAAAPAYRQIIDGLRLLLVSGELKPGDTLPAVRSLALDLGIHFSTVAEAYRTLAGEELVGVASAPWSVCDGAAESGAGSETHAEFGNKLRQLIAQVRAEGLSTSVISRELELLAKELPPSP